MKGDKAAAATPAPKRPAAGPAGAGAQRTRAAAAASTAVPAPLKRKPIAGGATAGPSGAKRQKAGDEIDAIFGSAAKAAALRREQQAAEAAREDERRAKRQKIEAKVETAMPAAELSRAGRKKTEDGLYVYTENELRVNAKSGGTADCPFDCDCCF